MTITREIRYAARGLRKNVGFALVVVLTLGFGMGANAAIFSLMDQVLLRSLPVRDPSQLVLLDGPGAFQGRTFNRMTFSYPMYVDVRDRNEVLSGVLATVSHRDDGRLAGPIRARQRRHRQRQLLRRPRRRSGYRPRVQPVRRSNAGRAPCRGPQLRLLAAPVWRRPGGHRSDAHRQRSSDDHHWRGGSGLHRYAGRIDQRRHGADDDESADDANLERSRQSSQPLGDDHGPLEVGNHAPMPPKFSSMSSTNRSTSRRFRRSRMSPTRSVNVS